jgi:hypothetical protein
MRKNPDAITLVVSKMEKNSFVENETNVVRSQSILAFALNGNEEGAQKFGRSAMGRPQILKYRIINSGGSAIAV